MLGNLRFVRSGEDVGDKEGMLQMAAEAVQNKGVKPEWVGPGVAMGDKGLVYVMDNFDSSDFKQLLGKCRVIGPAVVLAHINKGWPLPASTQPIFSLAMRGVVACFTQIGTREKREHLSHLVLMMGGKVQKDYTKHVTHLIAGQVGSTKYNVARDLGMSVMLPSWVEHCWTTGLNSFVLALEPDIVIAHRCPPFTGCTVTVTGLEENERKRVREAVEAHGGVYSGELTKDVCTHLLVNSTTSAKYKFAQQWQVHCVSPQWLYDSVRRGYCLAETSYSVGGGTATGGSAGEKKNTSKDAVSSGSGVAVEWTGALEDYQLPASAAGDAAFLDGCRLFLAGFSETQLQKLHKIVNLGGGARYNHLSESLTHVVLGIQEPSTMASIRNLGQMPHVVSALWLLACCTEGERVDELPYMCLDLSEGVSGEDERAVKRGGRKKRRLEEGEGERGDSSGKRPRVGGREEEVNGGDDDDETRLDEEALLLQYQHAEFPAVEVNERGGSGVLQGLKLAVSCLFPSEDQSLASSVLKEHGGEVVSVKEAGYLLSPLEVVDRTAPGRPEELSSPATSVTMIWLQRSIEAGEVLEPTSNFLFQPLAVKIVDTVLTDCVLAFSQFSDLEREHLIRFSKGLGAIVQDYFTHYPAHGLLATTHLVLRTPDGDKYQHAKQWGVPAVSDSWLFECAETGSIVPIEPHLILASHNDHHNPHEHSQESSRALGGVRETETQRQRDRGEGEGEEDDENDLGGGERTVVENGRTGEGEKEREADSCLRQKGEDEVDKKEREQVLEGVVIYVHRKISAKAHLHNLAGSLGADCHWSYDDSCTHYIYQGKAAEAVRDKEVRAARESGCLIVSPHWIHACVSEERRVEEMAYPHTYNPNLSLNISISSSQQRRESRTAKPQSYFHNAQSAMRQESKAEVAVKGNKESDMKKKAEAVVEERSSPVKERGEANKRGEAKGDKVTDDVASEVVRKIQQQLEEIKEAPREMRRRKSRRLQQQDPEQAASSSLPPPLPSGSGQQQQQTRQRRSRRTRKREEPLADSMVSDSQVLQVTYDDPEGRKEKAKLLARIEREEKLRAQGLDPEQFRDSNSQEEARLKLDLTQPEQPTPARVTCGQPTPGEPTQSSAESRRQSVAGAGVGSDRESGVSSTPVPPCLGVPIVTHSKGRKEVKSLFDQKEMQAKRKAVTAPKFLLSALQQREKVDYAALIQELGGEYIDLDYYTNSCTHIVVGKANRTEKFLGACAGGKWVLHKSYMEACRAERRFVEEEAHEWGVSAKESELQPLDRAPRQWRIALAQQRMSSGSEPILGAFQGWKVLLCVERNKSAGLKRLLEAGGAQVFSTTTKLSEAELQQISHAFINTSHIPKDSVSVGDLVKCGVACLKPEYIADYLCKGRDVPLESYFIKEVKALGKKFV